MRAGEGWREHSQVSVGLCWSSPGLWEGSRAEDAPITPAHQSGILFGRHGTENSSGIVAVV